MIGERVTMWGILFRGGRVQVQHGLHGCPRYRDVIIRVKEVIIMKGFLLVIIRIENVGHENVGLPISGEIGNLDYGTICDAAADTRVTETRHVYGNVSILLITLKLETWHIWNTRWAKPFVILDTCNKAG